MRLFAKFFLCTSFVISVALLLSGYLLITLSHESAITRETERALNQFQYDRFTVQASIISNTEGMPHSAFSRLSSELSGLTAFFSEDKQLIYTALPLQVDFSLIENVYENTHVLEFQTIGDATYIIVCGRITQRNIIVYLLIANDISTVISQREQMMQSFVQIYFLTLLFSMFMILILSAFITRPIKKINKAAAEISQGRYNERLKYLSTDELGELSNSFNLMAEAIEEKIYELSENARKKEDFVANFAHELKTPLTSVIGYADMLYQKELSKSQIKDASWYILNEGLRLEALSLKLMDLIVLSKQDFVLEEMSVEELFKDILGSLKPMLDDKNILVYLSTEPAYINVEYDLFKTLVFNLIDNAVKAECKRVDIVGKKNEQYYNISIIDNGRGMKVDELERITEAFYTIDKSRSRRQHGAGIGLALVAKIAEIHGTKLTFESIESVGTTVKIDLSYKGSDSGE
ncbi:MAG: HAMP domain-containing histidine kinase [Defluviitaleaceae bacterium]|nr:HAMP domain-containing histidine kinase [Defluviitaleaceae bacterium]